MKVMAYKKHAARLGLGLAVCLLLVGSFGIYLYARPIPALAAQTVQPASDKTVSVSLPWPAYGEAALGAVGYGVFATHGTQTPRATASLAKIMTALAVLKKHPLALGQQGPTITITRQDQAIYDYYFTHDGSLVAIKVGEKITEYQALVAMLLPSANNMADTLANWTFGSIDAYSAYANALAKTYGLTNSDFTSASGFPPTTVSTAQDLVQLGQVALANPVLAKIVALKSATVPVAGTIDNVNWLLGTHGIDGIKTGNNDADKGAFMGASTVKLPTGQTVQLVSVVMGAPNLSRALTDSAPILDTAKENFVVKTPVQAGQSFGTYTTPWDGKAVHAVAASPVSLLTWSGTSVDVSVKLDNITSHFKVGDQIGTVTATIGAKTMTVPLKLQEKLTSPTFWWRLHR